MICPKCKTQLFIDGTRYIAINDDTEEKPTKLYYEQDLVCRNKKCSNHSKVVETIREELKLSTQ